MTSISRRSFVGGAAAVTAASAVASLGASSAKAEPGKLHSWEVVPDPIPADQIGETIDADVVVVGAGVAGMSAFMHAAEAGAKTVLIEKLDNYNGRGLDFGAIDTKIQKAAGVEFDKGKVLNDLMKASGYKADGTLIKLWIDNSGKVFDRLIDMTEADGGQVVLGMGSRASANAEDFATRTYPTDHMFGGLIEGTMSLLGRMQDAGIAAGGQVIYETKAEQLLKADDGRIAGVVASTADGYIQINASKGVILATGDYGHNEEMLEAWCPLALKAEGNCYPMADANTGDGINMAYWVGGVIQPSCHAAMVHPIFGGGAMSTASYMKVNGSGKRFCNENTTLPGISNMYMCNAGRKVWTIFDDDFEAQVPAMSPLSNYNNETAGPLTKLFLAGEADPANPPTPTEVVNICLENGDTVKADTIEELAEKIGVPPANLAATVARYNELVEKGVDEDFDKDADDLKPIVKPPFYASRGTAQVLAIATGLNVNSFMQVLDKDDNALEGLYAVGNVMGNYFANDYPICCPGQSHGRCLTLGALVGKAVALDTDVQSVEY